MRAHLIAALMVMVHSTLSPIEAVGVTVASVPPPPPPITDNPGEQIPGPANPEDPSAVAAWRASLEAWRARMLAKIDYNGSIYDVRRSQLLV